MADFGKKPVVRRIFVRVQEMDGTGHASKTKSMNVWGASFGAVVESVEAVLAEAFGQPEDAVAPPAAEPERPVVKAKVGRRG